MAVRVALRHSTSYRYDRPVRLSPQTVRLRPAVHSRTVVEAFSLAVTPAQYFLNWQQDPFGNYLARLVFPEDVTVFEVTVDLIANLITLNPFDFFLEPQAECYPLQYESGQERDLAPYLRITDVGERFRCWAEGLQKRYATTGRRLVDVLVDLNRHLQATLRYDIRMEPGVFAPDETLERGHGSCRDFAWLLVNLLRYLGIAARFVSGYSIQLVADQRPLEGPIGVSRDCSDLHAWAEAYLPGAGWVGLDATSGLWCGEGHIPLACTAEPAAAAPISGSFEFTPQQEGDEVQCEFSFSMEVKRIEDRPRPTRSYTDEQFTAIIECGHHIDRILDQSDVRMTLGGEPTFVSIDDMDAPEWNAAALGPTKPKLADQLLRRLRQRFAPQGVLVHGQGKWYPGEPLPRWAYSLYFRKDGEPIWRDLALLSDGTDTGQDVTAATRFMSRLVELLGLPPENVLPAYEDTFYYLWCERKLPSNVDPFDSRLDDEQERERLRRIFMRGLDAVVGLALPLRAQCHLDGSHDWETGRWFLREERLYLLPGDSPMGYRLPLDSLPWALESDRAVDAAPDPFANFEPPRRHEQLAFARRPNQKEEIKGVHPVRGSSSANVVRSALCIEPRGGVLHVFVPPIQRLDAYLELTAKLEVCARELAVPIRIEGYPPPYHPVLERISVTPDPGVLEVNIHPAASWDECVAHTTALYEEARLTRLGTDKFMLDGRHAGTGGGNHVVIGGPTASDSPLLRRPDLLMSLLAFFNNHPALSYVFSGLFVGPTSQAPRVDEARNDSLYELEIARRVLDTSSNHVPPWLVDRTLRHLLVDLSGNTHRAEFCIDKLYNPDSSSGRLGLLELRAFEMPPDARMSCAQQLLVRALVAHFWRQPYRNRLVRWGTTLHDRFALPYFLREDLTDALLQLAPLGASIDPNWFLPHWEFRFPRIGQVTVSGGIRIELRQALEPWHVLGEEQNQSGTARYVDSSVERIQILVDGLTDARHLLTANRSPVPLMPTGRSGQFVAGIRYKAWKPPSSLHPTLDVNTPLVFDLYDVWNQRALGGATYYAAHPGGRAYERFPSNGLEAESRRMARFFPFGHHPGSYEPASPVSTLEFPLTLDLRYPS